MKVGVPWHMVILMYGMDGGDGCGMNFMIILWELSYLLAPLSCSCRLRRPRGYPPWENEELSAGGDRGVEPPAKPVDDHEAARLPRAAGSGTLDRLIHKLTTLCNLCCACTKVAFIYYSTERTIRVTMDGWTDGPLTLWHPSTLSINVTLL